MKPEDPDKPWRPRNTRGRFSYAKTMDKTVPSCYTNIVQSLLASKTGEKIQKFCGHDEPSVDAGCEPFSWHFQNSVHEKSC